MTTFTISKDEFNAIPTMAAPALAGIYNSVAALIGEKPVNRFADRATALKRTQAMLAKVEVVFESDVEEDGFEADLAGETDAEEAPAPQPQPGEPQTVVVAVLKKERAKRIMRFNFKPSKDGIKDIREKENSLRGRVIQLLRRPQGGTFAEVVATVHAFDAARGSTPGHQERRAYEIVRICHYYLGWGISHDIETGAIRLYTKEEGR